MTLNLTPEQTSAGAGAGGVFTGALVAFFGARAELKALKNEVINLKEEIKSLKAVTIVLKDHDLVKLKTDVCELQARQATIFTTLGKMDANFTEIRNNMSHFHESVSQELGVIKGYLEAMQQQDRK